MLNFLRWWERFVENENGKGLQLSRVLRRPFSLVEFMSHIHSQTAIKSRSFGKVIMGFIVWVNSETWIKVDNRVLLILMVLLSKFKLILWGFQGFKRKFPGQVYPLNFCVCLLLLIHSFATVLLQFMTEILFAELQLLFRQHFPFQLSPLSKLNKSNSNFLSTVSRTSRVKTDKSAYNFHSIHSLFSLFSQAPPPASAPNW